MFYTMFYIGIMVVLAVLNGIQFGASKGLGLRRGANIFQMLVFMLVPVAFVIEGQTSAFHFWTILAFFLCAMFDVIELTLVFCGKLGVKKESTITEKQGLSPSKKRGAMQKIRDKGESIVRENPRTSQALSIVFSLLLTLGVFIVSILLVTGYFFK